MMKKLLPLALLFLLTGVTSALAQDVRYNFDSQANFASFKTYKWVVLKTDTPMNNIVDGQIKASVNAELAKKGLTESKTDEADLFIGYQAAVDTEKQFTSYQSGWGYGPGWYGAGWYGGGGKFFSSLAIALSRFFFCFSGLAFESSVLLAVPRQTSVFGAGAYMSSAI